MILQTNRRDGKAIREKGGKEITIIKVIKERERKIILYVIFDGSCTTV
jgi:hypothetical protein